ncbi:hypothetical protein [Bacillus sp. 1P02SD]|uniref:hypothetical protein n=1 Tax=Bacillus sp. 1P02SD TaxID=3132264 RepID=UPI0039A085B2
MSPLIALLIIVVALLADYFWFDVDKKRWGWMKNWSKLNKGLFLSGLTVVTVLIYVGLSIKYFN